MMEYNKMRARTSRSPSLVSEPGRSADGCGEAATRRNRLERSTPRVEREVTLIDTAPVYGFGGSEEIVGRALARDG